ncbi:MAG: hypothetical protein K2W82_06540 [Candidatus Obscuribacterales bacterium]|nr:hypothetical protein [Candidatus Obscuribacterales bacterium]
MTRPLPICFLFFLSGMTSLILELVWSRILVRGFGATIFAGALVTAAFMSGLALGSFLAGFYLSKREPQTQKLFIVYGCLELFIAASGILLPWIFSQEFSTNYFSSFATTLLLLLLPCTAMGATFPIVSTLRQDFAKAYAANCFGAVLGCFIAGFYLIPAYGLTASSYFASLLGFFIFLATLSISGKSVCPQTITPCEIETKSETKVRFIAFVSGFALILLELSWLRFFAIFCGSSTYCLSLVLGMTLLALATGAWLVRFFSSSRLSWLLIATAVSLLPAVFCTNYSHILFATLNSGLGACFVLYLFYAFPTGVFSGMILPLSAKLETKVSKLYGLNCLGATLGALSGGFILIPSFGIEPILRNIIFTYLLLGCLLFRTNKSKIAAISFALLILFAPSVWSPPQIAATECLAYKEGLNSTISITEAKDLNLVCLRNNGKIEATLPIDLSLIAPGSDRQTHIMLAELPLLLHTEAAKDVLLIGLGSGLTANSLLEYPEISLLHIVELEPAVIELNKLLPAYAQTKKDNRIKWSIDDARQLLSWGKNRFDLIVSQPSEPFIAGSSDLYTKEFWSLAKKRLAKDGIFCQWIQLYSIPDSLLDSLISTFQAVYPRTFICHSPGAGEIILLGFNSTKKTAFEIIDKKINSRLKDSILLEQAGIFKSEDLLAQIRQALPKQTTSESLDDNLIAEFASNKELLINRNNIKINRELVLQRQQALIPSLQDCLVGLEPERTARLARSLAVLQQTNEALALAETSTRIMPSSESYWIKSLIESDVAAATSRMHCAQHQPITLEDFLSKIDLHLSSSQFAQAKAALGEAREKYPNAAPLDERAGWIALSDNQAQQALTYFNLARQKSRRLLLSYLGQAYAYNLLGNKVASRSALSSYLQINPWSFSAQLFYTSLLLEDKNWSQAFIHAGNCLQLQPESKLSQRLVRSGKQYQPDALRQEIKEEAENTNYGYKMYGLP